jgi:hypothetical protein
MDAVAEAFEPVYGTPSWSVRRGIGSFLTFEFGPPSLEIDDVRELPAHVGGEFIPVPRRLAYVHGEWHLWIYMCAWSLSWRDREIAHSESDDLEIDRALGVLNGQSLTKVSAGAPDGTSSFVFELSCVLSTRPTRPYDAAEDYDRDEWMFFHPPGRVLKLYGDGRLESKDSDEPRY